MYVLNSASKILSICLNKCLLSSFLVVSVVLAGETIGADIYANDTVTTVAGVSVRDSVLHSNRLLMEVSHSPFCDDTIIDIISLDGKTFKKRFASIYIFSGFVEFQDSRNRQLENFKSVKDKVNIHDFIPESLVQLAHSADICIERPFDEKDSLENIALQIIIHGRRTTRLLVFNSDDGKKTSKWLLEKVITVEMKK